jgi:hypothetical protein
MFGKETAWEGQPTNFAIPMLLIAVEKSGGDERTGTGKILGEIVAT